MTNFFKNAITQLATNFSTASSAIGKNEILTNNPSSSVRIEDKKTPRTRPLLPSKIGDIIGDNKTVILIVLVIIVAVVTILFISGNRPDQAVQRQFAQQSTNIGKSFAFPIRDSSGKETEQSLKMNLTTAEKTTQILIKGKPATAREGKLFLIVNLELDNPTKDQLSLSPVELIRLVDSSGKKFAPDVHNDEVKVEPISIKRSRIGFVIDQTEKNFKLQVGEVQGEKQLLDLVFN